MIRRAAVLALAAASLVCAQQASFEVASIHVSPPVGVKSEGKFGMRVDGAEVDIASMPLADIVRQAYALKSYQFAGPEWMSAARFDIHAKLPAGSTPDDVPAMLQALLADRFKLTFHRESKEHSVYAVGVAKSGLKMPEADPVQPVAPPPNKKSANIHLDRNMTVQAICDYFARFFDRPLVDMTGLTTKYHVLLDIPILEFKRSAEAAAAGKSLDGPSDPAGSAAADWLQQLGLKVESRKAPVDLLVIDHAEKVPTEN